MNKSVTKHNDLVEASYKLTLDEQRLILICIARINPFEPLPEGNRFEVTVEEFCGLFGVDPRSAYDQMKEAADRLAERWIIVNGNKNHRIRWLDETKYIHGEGRVVIGFSPKVTPYLSALSKNFTEYKLGQVAGFKSAHSIRLYELLIRFDDSGLRLISLDQFKDRLDIADQYPQFSKLKQRVIDPAVDEINEKSDLKVGWRAIRKKRVVHMLEFKYTKEEASAPIPEQLIAKSAKKPLIAKPPAKPVDRSIGEREIALMRETLGIKKKTDD
jgi:plasmid replication initiation protein